MPAITGRISFIHLWSKILAMSLPEGFMERQHRTKGSKRGAWQAQKCYELIDGPPRHRPPRVARFGPRGARAARLSGRASARARQRRREHGRASSFDPAFAVA